MMIIISLIISLFCLSIFLFKIPFLPFHSSSPHSSFSSFSPPPPPSSFSPSKSSFSSFPYSSSSSPPPHLLLSPLLLLLILPFSTPPPPPPPVTPFIYGRFHLRPGLPFSGLRFSVVFARRPEVAAGNPSNLRSGKMPSGSRRIHIWRG